MAFPRQTQQAFLEAHAEAFLYFGGVCERLRYDNLKSAARKVLRGRNRQESDRFVVMRSHDLYAAEFCIPRISDAHEKGGVEGAWADFDATTSCPCRPARATTRSIACCSTPARKTTAGMRRTECACQTPSIRRSPDPRVAPIWAVRRKAILGWQTAHGCA